MINIRDTKTNVLAAAVGTLSIAAIIFWQFRLFVTFQGSRGAFEVPGGSLDLWWAIGAGLMACVASFYVFSVFVRFDRHHEIPLA